MHFQRHHLKGDHYHWDPNPINEMFSGHPSRRLFDRFNGDQVLFIINSFGSMCDEFTPETGAIVEKKISEQLPMDARSEISVLNWLNLTLKRKINSEKTV